MARPMSDAMQADTPAAEDGLEPRCQKLLAREHYQDIRCNRPALAAIELPQGRFYLCKRHLTPSVYALLEAKGYAWRAVAV